MIAVESRKDDKVIIRMLNKLNHEETAECANLEPALQHYIVGDCFLPLGINAEIRKKNIICKLFLQFEECESYLRLNITKKPDEQAALLDEIKEKIDNYRK